MKTTFNTLQKRIGMLIAFVGTIVVVGNIAEHLYQGENLFKSIQHLNVSVLLVFVITGYVSVFVENNLFKFLQVFVLVLSGILNIIDSYNEFYGPALFFMGWLLMRQYGYFNTHKKLKYGFLIAFLVLLFQFSAFNHNKDVFILNNGMVQFTLFMVLFVLAVWKDIFDRDEKLLKENIILKSNYNNIAKEIESIEMEKKPFELSDRGITPAEERVIKVLVQYRSSNKEIAERLNISESTVKLHLYNIFNKLGVDNRFTVIDLCRYNFTK